MQSTCDPQNCKWHALLGGDPAQCPNYIESWWKPSEGDPVLVKDCAPKRTMLMVQELYNQQVRLQSSTEEQRNQSLRVNYALGRIINEHIKKNAKEDEGIVAIEGST